MNIPVFAGSGDERHQVTQMLIRAHPPDNFSGKKTIEQLVKLDERKGTIVGVALVGRGATGHVNLFAAPRNLVRLDLSGNQLCGPADLTNLPLPLEFLSLAANSFSGPVDVTQLPARLSELHLQNNAFCGLLHVGALPMGLKALYAQKNKLVGLTTDAPDVVDDKAPAFDFGKLPRALKYLNVVENPLLTRMERSKVPKGITVWM